MTSISNICIHHGEEPVLSGGKGIINVFFTGCNMRCVYCQNYQISQLGVGRNRVEDYVGDIFKLLDGGYDTIGFVSPSHCFTSVMEIITKIRDSNYCPTIVYNSNGYDKIGNLKALEGLVDVYLPDFKYASNELGKALSGVKDYYDVAINAIKEMYRQKGSMLIRDVSDKAVSGLIIRHLVLPGYVANSVDVLTFIANEISTSVHISLMSQYNPTEIVDEHSSLSRRISECEYDSVKQCFDELGFRNGWFQELDSANNLNPDFTKEEAFQ